MVLHEVVFIGILRRSPGTTWYQMTSDLESADTSQIINFQINIFLILVAGHMTRTDKARLECDIQILCPLVEMLTLALNPSVDTSTSGHHI